VDNVTGYVYFADNTQPEHTDKAQATIHIYSAGGNEYKGHLRYNVVHGLPVGLAVDNSENMETLPNKAIVPTQGRVYVTSGNTTQAGVYAYAPGSGIFTSPQPPLFSLSVASTGSGAGAVRSAAAKLDCEGTCERELLAGGSVPLTASPEPGSEFAGWSGACSGDALTCKVKMDQAASVSGEFVAVPPSPEDPSLLHLRPASPVAPAGSGRQLTGAGQRANRRHRARRCHSAKHRKTRNCRKTRRPHRVGHRR
jgi:hypothetical protein